MTIEDGFLLTAAIVAAAWLFSPQIRKSHTWRATVTPLASIIGSGFLVSGPLLAVIVGKWAPIAMLAIGLLAFAIGGIIRFNIRHLEPLLDRPSELPRGVLTGERLSNISLSAAYAVSIAFYLRLLASFVLHGFNVHEEWIGDLLTTVILLFIGIAGYFRGLETLEKMEKFSVTVKLAIIAALLLGLGIFDMSEFSDIMDRAVPTKDGDWFARLRELAGLLLIVQGFETSRYLSAEYDTDTRINTMRQAQFVSGVIYVVFVLLAMPLLTHLENTVPDETAIIELAKLISPVLPALLIVAAVMSQFSAAVADTAGGGGLLEEATKNKVSANSGYLIMTAIAIALVWTADIFQIISIASRAFAFYYLLQGVSALLIARKAPNKICRRADCLRFGALIAILAFVVIFGIGAEG
ncbi:MAG: hypothetical protein KDN22_05005 [Verrucomicrobiae bacterium]|nr:hypothetical protein [Verrucomicrobiae bacterium]